MNMKLREQELIWVDQMAKVVEFILCLKRRNLG